jgi:two-component system, cell cycle sensor histidine kinase and response regulator CckA
MRVLIVDDDAGSLEMQTLLLKGEGYEVSGARGGKEALEMAVKAPPDLVLSDVLMPGMDGFELCRNWISNPALKHIPFVFYSAAFVSDEDMEFGMSLGGARYIRKPSEPGAFLAAIGRLIRQKESGALQASESTGLPGELAFYREYSGRIHRKLTTEVGSAETRQVVNRLEVSERKYELLFESINDAVLVLDAEDETILEANGRACELYGRERQEMVGMSLAVMTRDKEKGKLHIREILESGEGRNFESVHYHKSGRSLNLEISSKVLEYGGRRVLTAVLHDVTERLREREALERSEEKYRELVENINDLIFTADRDGVVTYASPVVERMAGYTPGEVIGRSLWEFVDPEDRPRLGDRFRAALQGEVVPDEYRIVDKHGGARWVRSSSRQMIVGGEVVGIRGVVTDIHEEKKSQIGLERSEQRYRQLVENINDIIFSVDLNGVVTYVSPAAVRITGVNPDLAVGRPIENFVSPQDRHRIRRSFQNALQQETEAEVFRVAVPKGDVRYMLVSFHAQGARGAEQTILGVTTDITAQIRTEEALEGSEKRYRLLFEQNQAGVFYTTWDGIILDSNRAAAELVGYQQADNLRGLRITNFYANPEERQSVLRILQEEGQLKNYPVRARRRDGSCLWVLLSLAVISDPGRSDTLLLATVIDNTSQVEANERVRQLAAALDQTADAIIVTDSEANIEYVNPAFQKITGYSFEEVYGKNPRLMQSGATSAETYEKLWKTIKGGDTWRGRFTNKRKDGTIFQDHTSISPVRDEGGAITHFVAVKRDVTREIELESRLMQMQKMEAVGRLAGGVAHDFNNILTAILNNAETLRSSGKLNEDLSQPVMEIIRSGERAASLTRRLLAFGRKQLASHKVLDLNTVVRSAMSMLQSLIGENIHFTSVFGRNLWSVKVDPNQMEQVLVNLLINARDSISGTGEIHIETANVDLDEAYPDSGPEARAGRYVALTVSDTGEGIPKNLMSKIFEPFFTTKSPDRGTGLGLATVYGIVKQSGGTIQVHSQEGRGSTFKIYLPAVAEAVMPRGSQNEVQKVAGGSETILVVEDDAQVREVVAAVLDSLGYRVLACAGVKEAKALFQSQKGRIALLLTDLVMPDGNGSDLADDLSAQAPDLGIIFMSGYSSDPKVREKLREGKVAFLQKPFTRQVLSSKLREVLDAKRAPA